MHRDDVNTSATTTIGGVSRRRPHLAVPFGLLAAAALVLAACSSSGTAGSTTTTAKATTTTGSSGTPASSSVEVKTTHDPTLGVILVDASGRTLYRFQLDHQGSSSCTGSCATLWPPLTVSGTAQPTAGAGVTGLGVIERSDGTRQVTYQGYPLYLYQADHAAGQTNGNGVGGVWSVVKAPSGSAAPASSGTGTSSGSTGSSGYGGSGY
jgi:predicted lipoprotein with Yx(FWY)xxD motif